MSQDTEIEFENTDSPNWATVKLGAQGVANKRLQNRYDAVIEGAQLFRDGADTLVKDAIKKPPGHLSGFGVLVESVMAACVLLVPEAGLAAEIAEAVKGTYETLKPAKELVDKANEEVVADSVEQATNYLQELTKTYAQNVTESAGQIKKDAEDAVGAALDSYITQNPQPLKPGDDQFYASLCDAIGIKDADLSDIKQEVWNQVFPPFKSKVLAIAAQMHFFHELDNDMDRLNFLMDEADKGDDPDALLNLIGGDQSYWDPFLAVYRSDGRPAAMLALERKLGLPV